MIVDNMVWNCLALKLEDKLVAHEGLGLAVGHCLGMFNANNSMVGSWDLEWLQGTLNVILGLFWKHRLVVNVAKYKV